MLLSNWNYLWYTHHKMIMFVNTPVCSLREILSEQTMSVLEEEMNVDYMILQGITSRTRHCKLKTLDLRGIEISKKFNYLRMSCKIQTVSTV